MLFHSKLTNDIILQEEEVVNRLFVLIMLAILLAVVVLFSPNNTAISVADTGTRNIEEAWIWNPSNDHYYMLTESMSWTEAEAWSQERGGHLVTLRNWEEELWIKDKFGRDELFWIGFNDIEEEGNWVWSSGEPMVYTNWQIREPNNCDDWPNCYPEDSAVMNWGTNAKIGGQWFNYCGDYWNDLDSSQTHRGVAEIVPDYILTISSTAGGSVITPGEGEFTYKDGTLVDLVAEPEEGYHFINWTGNVTTIANVNGAETTITMDGHYEIIANFIAQYYLTIDSTDGGVVTAPGEGTFTYDPDMVVELVATPDVGYRFINWTGDAYTIADVDATETTIIMEGDYEVTANFEEHRGCFIATAAYGTPMAEEIEILREFRDEYLLTNPVGQAFVDFYYRVSPPMVEFINEHPSLKPVVRVGLLPAVAISTVAVNTTPVEKIAVVGLLVLASVGVAAWATKRRGRGREHT
jgi:hypothetical protein